MKMFEPIQVTHLPLRDKPQVSRTAHEPLHLSSFEGLTDWGGVVFLLGTPHPSGGILED